MVEFQGAAVAAAHDQDGVEDGVSTLKLESAVKASPTVPKREEDGDQRTPGEAQPAATSNNASSAVNHGNVERQYTSHLEQTARRYPEVSSHAEQLHTSQNQQSTKGPLRTTEEALAPTTRSHNELDEHPKIASSATTAGQIEATSLSATAAPAAESQTAPSAVQHAAVEDVIVADHPRLPRDQDDDDEALGSDYSFSGATSLSSSVRDYAFENSRRYHKYKEGAYHFPNDEPEQEREDMKHAMVVHLCAGKLTWAPLTHPQKILDIGTGTGIWAIDMGDEYPEAEVIGIDLSPIQPQWVPPNVKFVVDDLEAEWVYADNSFDLIHLRNMTPCVKDWPRVLEQAMRVLKPGGWIDFQDMRWMYGCDDDTMRADYTPPQMIQNIVDGLAQLGVNMNSALIVPNLIHDAGFDNVQAKVQKVPVGPWAKNKDMKKIGLYCRSIIHDGLQAITMGPYTRGLKWSREQVEVFLVQVRRDLMDYSVHSYVHFHSALGQKPFA